MTPSLKTKIVSYYKEHPNASILEIAGAFYSATREEIKDILKEVDLNK